MDGWMTCDFTSFSTVFQSYQDDGQIIMKGCVQWNSVDGWENFPSSGARTRASRSVGQCLIHWATWAPASQMITLIILKIEQFCFTMASKRWQLMANTVDPDQTAPLGAVWSGSALFVQTYLSQYVNILQYLLFQSLLCSGFTSSQLAEKVSASLGDHPQLTGYDSVNILCMIHVSIEMAIHNVIDKFPVILARFGTAALKDSYSQVSFVCKLLNR